VGYDVGGGQSGGRCRRWVEGGGLHICRVVARGGGGAQWGRARSGGSGRASVSGEGAGGVDGGGVLGVGWFGWWVCAGDSHGAVGGKVWGWCWGRGWGLGGYARGVGFVAVWGSSVRGSWRAEGCAGWWVGRWGGGVGPRWGGPQHGPGGWGGVLFGGAGGCLCGRGWVGHGRRRALGGARGNGLGLTTLTRGESWGARVGWTRGEGVVRWF